MLTIQSARHCGQSIAMFSGIFAFAAPPATAQVASALLREGDAPVGAPAGAVVSSIANSAVNNVGGYSFTIVTTGSGSDLSHAWGNVSSGGSGAVLRTEGVFGSLTQTAFETFFGMDDTGAIAYSPTCSDGVFTGLDSAWLGDVPYAVERDPVGSLPGQFWVFASRVGVTGNGQLYWGGGFSTTQGGATENRGLFIGIDATPLYLGGQTPPNLPFPINGSTIDFDYRVSALGTHWIAPLTMSTTSTTDGTILIDGEGLLIDGALAREGSPVPASIGGLVGENWGTFDVCGITEAGQYFFVQNTSAATTQDEIVVVNGQIAYREGQTLDGQTLSGTIDAGYMNEDGDVALEWDIGTAIEVLIVNDQIVLTEGDAVDLDGDGITEPNSILRDISGGIAMTLGPRDDKGFVNVYFTANIDTLGTPTTLDDIEGAFTIRVPVDIGTPCLPDIAPEGGDGQVDVDDLLAIINGWGACKGSPCPPDIAPEGGDGQVDVDDLLAVINGWGECN